MVVVTGARSFIVVDGGVGDVGFPVMFFPSTPLLGWGAAAGMPCCVGVWLCFCGGCVIAGGAFW